PSAGSRATPGHGPCTGRRRGGARCATGPVAVTRTGRLLVPVDDTPLGQVVRRHLDVDAVAGEDADEELPHLAGEEAEDGVTVVELDAELGVGEGLGDDAFL